MLTFIFPSLCKGTGGGTRYVPLKATFTQKDKPVKKKRKRKRELTKQEETVDVVLSQFNVRACCHVSERPISLEAGKRDFSLPTFCSRYLMWNRLPVM